MVQRPHPFFEKATQREYTFNNGLKLSAVRGLCFEFDDLWELAVINPEGEFITQKVLKSDYEVMPYIKEKDMLKYLNMVNDYDLEL